MASAVRRSPVPAPGRFPITKSWKQESPPRSRAGQRRFEVRAGQRCESQSHTATAAMAAKKRSKPTTIAKFTLVVRRCTFTWGKPELSLSIDMTGCHGPHPGQLVRPASGKRHGSPCIRANQRRLSRYGFGALPRARTRTRHPCYYGTHSFRMFFPLPHF